jgi:hypothetical protein
MTEEEAKQRWCPFVRLTADQGGWHTNRDPSMPNSPSDTLAYRCLASACMAWRVKSETRRTSGGYPYPVTVGYCGLAGSPE